MYIYACVHAHPHGSVFIKTFPSQAALQSAAPSALGLVMSFLEDPEGRTHAFRLTPLGLGAVSICTLSGDHAHGGGLTHDDMVEEARYILEIRLLTCKQNESNETL